MLACIRPVYRHRPVPRCLAEVRVRLSDCLCSQMATVGLRTCWRTSARARARHWNENDVTDLPKVDEKQKLGPRERRRTRTLESRDPEHVFMGDDCFLIAIVGACCFCFPLHFRCQCHCFPQATNPCPPPAFPCPCREPSAPDRQGSRDWTRRLLDDLHTLHENPHPRDPEPRSTTQVASGIVGTASDSATRA